MKNKTHNLKYSQAVKELEEILSGLREQEIDVDDLSAKVKRAMEIINFCKQKISSTEMEIKNIMKMFEKNKED
ncbi:exodeoxyribonuclease VII small subunit [bacterium]|nr:MAG: exodeoxyribonuclease VII small subunit [bacterium]